MSTERADYIRTTVMPIVRWAAKRAIDGDWRVGKSGAFIHTESGHWGQVAFRLETDRSHDLAITAGALSPFLTRVVNGLNPERYPPPAFIAAHARTAWFQPIKYEAEHLGPATSTDPVAADPALDDLRHQASPVLLGPDSAPEWLELRTRHLIQRIAPLLSDVGLRDWLVTTPSLHHLRYAILLTRHLGLDDEIPDLLERDAEEYERRREQSPIEPTIQAHYDRGRRYDSMWSHRRFVRWFETAELG